MVVVATGSWRWCGFQEATSFKVVVWVHGEGEVVMGVFAYMLATSFIVEWRRQEGSREKVRFVMKSVEG